MLKNMYTENRTMLKDVIPLEIPLCVCIEPTNLCNFKCVMCFHGNNEYAEEAKPLKNMSMDVFEKTICDLEQWCKKAGQKIKLIKLYSLGEPLLHQEIAYMVKRIKEADICNQIEITTNGSLLSRELAEKLVDYGLDILRISVYSVEEEHCKYITKSTVKPDEVYEKTLYLKEYRDRNKKKLPRIYAKMIDTYSDENDKFMNRWSDAADIVGLDAPFQLNLGENDVFEQLYPDDAEKAHSQALGTNLFTKRKACRYPFTHMTVRNDGRVVVCCADWLRETCVGDVTKQSLEEIWNSKELYDFRCNMLVNQGANIEACRKCELPYRDLPEDDLDGFPCEKLTYWKREESKRC